MLKIIGASDRTKSAEKLQHHFDRIINVTKELSSEFDSSRLYHSILNEAQHITNADGGTLYLLNKNSSDPCLEIVLMQNSNGIIGGNSTNAGYDFPALLLVDPQTGKPNDKNISTFTANSGHAVSIEDAYNTESFDFSGAHKFDSINKYHTKSVLSIPLFGEHELIIGVLQLINFKNAQDEIIGFNEELLPLVEALASMATLTLEKQLMVDSQRDLLIRLATASTPDHLFESVLDEAQAITHADGGTLYLLKGEQQPRLEFAILRSDTLKIKLGGTSSSKIEYEPLPLYEDGVENHNNVATHVALTGEVVNIPDAYNDEVFDFSGTKEFDKSIGYRSRSFLTIPMMNQNDEVIGVLQLLNARDAVNNEVVTFNPKLEPIIKALASYASIILNNQILVQGHKDLMDAFVKCIAKAIDAKSSHTSAHCQRVPRIMALLAEAACNDQQEAYKDFSLDDDEWYELNVASWMHDCGKLATPDRVLDKATKLQTLRDGIEIIRARFASRRQQLEVEHLKNMMANPGGRKNIEAQYKTDINQLIDDLGFIEKSNIGGEFMSDEFKERITNIANQNWLDAFGREQTMLTEEETYNLCISRGTITSEEREIINNHMAVTLDMLNSLPFPKKLRKVPEYAGGHHEKMDGSGFPNGLTGDQMSIPARMMAIADIFEALTAKERPYKEPMKISQSLSILRNMSENGHIDPDLFKLFLRSRIWETYAKEHCRSEQLDISDYSNYL